MFFFLGPSVVLAATNYGEGTYGGGVYNVGDTPAPATTTATGTSTAGPPQCTDTKPGSAPWLYGATARGSFGVLLHFTEAQDPVGQYVLEYGTQTGKYQFSAGNIGGRGTTSYSVQGLSANTTYYFRVRAGNGCATGDWSNEISARTQSLLTFPLGKRAATEVTNAVANEKPKEKTMEEGSTQEPAVLGVSVKIKVLDQSKKPVEGAKVTLRSTPRDAVTDKDGIAQFDQVEPGEHSVSIAYDGQSGEQQIYVKDDPMLATVDFTIQLRPISPFKDPAVMIVIGSLTIVIILLLATGYTVRRKSQKLARLKTGLDKA